eukprot:2016183-Lingulodinium_polyedra.AAC.1
MRSKAHVAVSLRCNAFNGANGVSSPLCVPSPPSPAREWLENISILGGGTNMVAMLLAVARQNHPTWFKGVNAAGGSRRALR